MCTRGLTVLKLFLEYLMKLDVQKERKCLYVYLTFNINPLGLISSKNKHMISNPISYRVPFLRL